MTFSYKRCARVLTLIAVSLLGLALLVRALVAFIEALAVLLLAVVVASLALPGGSAGTGVKHGGNPAVVAQPWGLVGYFRVGTESGG
ncbi:MAG: hypothetical protein ACLSAH_17275 [Bilophila wadsworthia]